MSNEQTNPTQQAAEMAILPRFPIPEGWRLLHDREIIQQGDKFDCYPDGWTETENPGELVPARINENTIRYIRPIEPTPQAPQPNQNSCGHSKEYIQPDSVCFACLEDSRSAAPADLPVTPALTHTPTPWFANGCDLPDGNPFWDIRTGPMEYSPSLAMLCGRANVQADAEFICFAVNSHASLLEAVTQAQAALDRYFADGDVSACEALDTLRAILEAPALVGGGAK